jgi:hypothetical protein
MPFCDRCHILQEVLSPTTPFGRSIYALYSPIILPTVRESLTPDSETSGLQILLFRVVSTPGFDLDPFDKSQPTVGSFFMVG